MDEPMDPGDSLLRLAPGHCRLHLRRGAAELTLEGSESFLRELLPALLASLGGATESGVAVPILPAATPPVLSPLGALAAEIGASPAHIEGALGPTDIPPWLHIDGAHWADFRDRSPKAGRNATNDVQFTALALALWYRHLDRQAPNLGDIRGAVKGSGLNPKNAARSIENSPLLQRRGDQVLVRPTELGRSRMLLRAFCLGQPVPAE